MVALFPSPETCTWWMEAIEQVVVVYFVGPPAVHHPAIISSRFLGKKAKRKRKGAKGVRKRKKDIAMARTHEWSGGSEWQPKDASPLPLAVSKVRALELIHIALVAAACSL